MQCCSYFQIDCYGPNCLTEVFDNWILCEFLFVPALCHFFNAVVLIIDV